MQSIEVNILDQPRILLKLSNRRTISLLCDVEFELKRWSLYLTILLKWFREKGKGQIAHYRDTLSGEGQVGYGDIV